MSAPVETAVRLVGPDTRVVLTVDAEPGAMRFEDFVTDNLADETIDWISIAAVLKRGETWLGGGGATPEWCLQVLDPDPFCTERALGAGYSACRPPMLRERSMS